MSFDLARTFGSQSGMRDTSSSSVFVKYSVYGWGVPLAIVCTTATLHFTVLEGTTFALYDLVTICWLRSGLRSGLVAFGGPVATLLIANIVLFTKTVVGIQRTRKSTAVTFMGKHMW